MPKKTIYQLIAHRQKKDAIGRMALGLHEALKKNSEPALIIEKNIKATQNIWTGKSNPDLCFFQHSTGSILAEKYLEWPSEKKVFIFQNITPIELLDSDSAKRSAELGYVQLKKLIESSDLCIGTSQFNCDTLKRFGATKIKKIPYLLPKRFSFFKRKVTPLVLMVSRVEPYKGMLEGLEAFHQAKKVRPELKMAIIGNLKANPKYIESLRAYVFENNLENSVKLQGRISDFWMDYYYSRGLCLLSLSDHEGFGVPILEAHRWQLPVIALDRGAVRETLGTGGVLIQEKNPSTVAFEILKLYENQKFFGEIQTLQKTEAKRFESLENQWIEALTKS